MHACTHPHTHIPGRLLCLQPVPHAAAEATGGQLLLIAGNAKLVELELLLTTTPLSDPVSLRRIGSVRHLFLRLADQFDLDYIVFDCAPSIGELNKVGPQGLGCKP